MPTIVSKGEKSRDHHRATLENENSLLLVPLLILSVQKVAFFKKELKLPGIYQRWLLHFAEIKKDVAFFFKKET